MSKLRLLATTILVSVSFAAPAHAGIAELLIQEAIRQAATHAAAQAAAHAAAQAAAHAGAHAAAQAAAHAAAHAGAHAASHAATQAAIPRRPMASATNPGQVPVRAGGGKCTPATPKWCQFPPDQYGQPSAPVKTPPTYSHPAQTQTWNPASGGQKSTAGSRASNAYMRQHGRANTPDQSSGNDQSSGSEKSEQASGEAGSCRAVPGAWTWPIVGGGVLYRNGTSNLNGIPGSWTCASGHVTITWSNGFVDQMTLSADGNSMAGNNNIGPVWASKR